MDTLEIKNYIRQALDKAGEGKTYEELESIVSVVLAEIWKARPLEWTRKAKK